MNANTILAGVIGATGLTVLNNLLNSKNSMQPIIGGFIVGTFLLVIALFNVQIAAALALLMLLASVLKNAQPVLSKVVKF